jgi:predicted regulator of Ras-like GTPase activity (Roadblock/LC7/MglB family)
VQVLELGQMEELIMTSSMGIFMAVDLGNTYTLMVGTARRATLGALRLLIEEYKPRLVNACPKHAV